MGCSSSCSCSASSSSACWSLGELGFLLIESGEGKGEEMGDNWVLGVGVWGRLGFWMGVAEEKE